MSYVVRLMLWRTLIRDWKNDKLRFLCLNSISLHMHVTGKNGRDFNSLLIPEIANPSVQRNFLAFWAYQCAHLNITDNYFTLLGEMILLVRLERRWFCFSWNSAYLCPESFAGSRPGFTCISQYSKGQPHTITITSVSSAILDGSEDLWFL